MKDDPNNSAVLVFPDRRGTTGTVSAYAAASRSIVRLFLDGGAAAVRKRYKLEGDPALYFAHQFGMAVNALTQVEALRQGAVRLLATAEEERKQLISELDAVKSELVQARADVKALTAVAGRPSAVVRASYERNEQGDLTGSANVLEGAEDPATAGVG